MTAPTDTTPVDAPRPTPIGVLGGHLRAGVDGAGGLQLERFALQWWVGAGDSWHRPGREGGCRQQRRNGAPVIDTAWRVAGGDVRSTAYATVLDGAEWVVLELRNDTRVPVLVALALAADPPPRARRAHRGPRWQVQGAVVTLDGRPALVAQRAVELWADAANGSDLFDRLAAERGIAFEPGSAVNAGSDERWVAAAFTLTHGATLRVAVAATGPAAAADEGGTGADSTTERPPPVPAAAPDGDSVARGWARHLDAVCRFDVGDDELERAVLGWRAQLLLDHDACQAGDVAALAAFGHHDEAVPRLQAGLTRSGPPHEPAVAAGLLVASASVVRWDPDAVELGRALAPVAAELAAWVPRRDPLASLAQWALAEVVRIAGIDQPSRPSLAAGTYTGWLTTLPGSEAAAQLLALRARLLRDEPDEPLELLAAWPLAPGRGVDVHGWPSARGAVSFAVRWHGPRPALLWQIEAPAEAPAPAAVDPAATDGGTSDGWLRCPSLDATFVGGRPAGEALLGVPVKASPEEGA